jgi:hypothetical protein
MTQLTIQDGLVQLINNQLADTTGTFTHNGNYTINGTLFVDSINVRNLVTENDTNLTDFIADTEDELNGQGFTWGWATGSAQLQYRTGGRLWASVGFDTAHDQAYKIDNVPVLTSSGLGETIVNSRLRAVGTLVNLTVSGDTTIGDFAHFNSSYNRLGLGTEEPSAAINILENNISIVLGSPTFVRAQIGTESNHDFAVVTDNISRVTVKSSGEVEVGDKYKGGGILNVYGTLTATNIVSDNRVERTHSLQFLATRDTNIYGLGLLWAGTGYTRQLTMLSGPDRLHSTESFDISEGQAYYANTQMVLNETMLGPTVVTSNLTKLGSLHELTVNGATRLLGTLQADQAVITAKTISFNDGVYSLDLTNDGISTNHKVQITTASNEIFYGDVSQISIGDKTLYNKPVKVFGKLSVGINNPDPSLNFSVNGDVSIGGKRLTTNIAPPANGTYAMGDICWNAEPKANDFIGWVCVTSGTPGQWLGFGQISNQ